MSVSNSSDKNNNNKTIKTIKISYINALATTQKKFKSYFVEKCKEVMHNKFVLCSLIFCLFFTLIRLPYVGTTIDYFFDFIFGYIKYLFYVLNIFILFSVFGNYKFAKYFKTKKFIYTSIFLCFFLACVVFSIYFSFSSNNDNILVNYFKAAKEYASVHTYHNGFFNKPICCGGVFATVIVWFIQNCLSLFVILFFVILLLIIILNYLNVDYKNSKIILYLKNFLIKKLGGSYDSAGLDEINMTPKFLMKFKKISDLNLEKILPYKKNPPFWLLPINDLNNANKNGVYINELKTKISNYFEQKKFKNVFFSTEVHTTYSEVVIDCSNQTNLNAVIKELEKILDIINTDQFFVVYEFSTLKLQFANPDVSYVCLGWIAKEITSCNSLDTVFAFDQKNQPVIYNLHNLGNILTIGQKLSGSISLILLVILSLSYISTPHELDITILSNHYELVFDLYKDNSPHVGDKVYFNNDKIVNCITSTRKKIESFMDKVIAKEKNKITKTSLIVLANFDQLLKNSHSLFMDLVFILKYGHKFNIYCLLHAKSVNNLSALDDIINFTKTKFIFSLETQYESLKLFNDEQGCQLFGAGDCLTYSGDFDPNSVKRIQCCYLSKKELKYDLKIIKAFYQPKSHKK